MASASSQALNSDLYVLLRNDTESYYVPFAHLQPVVTSLLKDCITIRTLTLIDFMNYFYC